MKLRTVLCWLLSILTVMLALYVAAKLYIIHHPPKVDIDTKIKLTMILSEEPFDFNNNFSSLSLYKSEFLI